MTPKDQHRDEIAIERSSVDANVTKNTEGSQEVRLPLKVEMARPSQVIKKVKEVETKEEKFIAKTPTPEEGESNIHTKITLSYCPSLEEEESLVKNEIMSRDKGSLCHVSHTKNHAKKASVGKIGSPTEIKPAQKEKAAPTVPLPAETPPVAPPGPPPPGAPATATPNADVMLAMTEMMTKAIEQIPQTMVAGLHAVGIGKRQNNGGAGEDGEEDKLTGVLLHSILGWCGLNTHQKDAIPDIWLQLKASKHRTEKEAHLQNFFKTCANDFITIDPSPDLIHDMAKGTLAPGVTAKTIHRGLSILALTEVTTEVRESIEACDHNMDRATFVTTADHEKRNAREATHLMIPETIDGMIALLVRYITAKERLFGSRRSNDHLKHVNNIRQSLVKNRERVTKFYTKTYGATLIWAIILDARDLYRTHVTEAELTPQSYGEIVYPESSLGMILAKIRACETLWLPDIPACLQPPKKKPGKGDGTTNTNPRGRGKPGGDRNSDPTKAWGTGSGGGTNKPDNLCWHPALKAIIQPLLDKVPDSTMSKVMRAGGATRGVRRNEVAEKSQAKHVHAISHIWKMLAALPARPCRRKHRRRHG